MASTIENIDNYLRKNKKSLYANLNKWQGYKAANGSFVLSDDAKKLKSLWETAMSAKGINNKLKAFDDLKQELTHWEDPVRLAELEAHLEANNIDNYEDPASKLEVDQYRFFDQLTNFPDTSELDDLNIDEAWSQGYNYKQMKALAEQYGYDYTDKEDRTEFLDKLRQYHEKKQLDEIWNDGTPAGAAVDFMLPVSKEYAKNNYQNIDTSSETGMLKDMAGPFATDVATNVAMFGAAGAPIKNPAVKMAVNNVMAPVIKGAGNYFANYESFEDVAKDVGGEVATNFATPFMVRRGANWVARPFQGGAEKQAAMDYINRKANNAREVQKKLRNGGVWQEFSMNGPNEIDKVEYKTIKKEKIPGTNKKEYVVKNIDATEYGKNKNKITEKELAAFGEDAGLLRTKLNNAEEVVRGSYAPDIKPASEYLTEAKMRNASMQGQDPMSVLTSDELEVMGATPKETFWNWAKTNPLLSPGEGTVSYITNAQGRGQYGRSLVGKLGMLDPTHTISTESVEKQPKLSDKEIAELNMLQRLRELHKAKPEMFKAPKIPEKYKKFFNEEQEKNFNTTDISINKIFGE